MSYTLSAKHLRNGYQTSAEQRVKKNCLLPKIMFETTQMQYLGGRVGANELQRMIRCSGGNVYYHPTTPRYIGVRVNRGMW